MVESREVVVQPEPVLRRHADHDPSLVCRPALGYRLCEVLPDGVDVRPWREVLGEDGGEDEA